ncbi:MAG: TIGR02281 family clan AA aspartic protease [Methylovirgula sp.]
MLRFALSTFIAVLAVSLVGSWFLSHKLALSASQPATQAAPQALPATLVAQAPQPSENLDRVEIAPDPSGNYLTDIDIDGQIIHVIVDTGATFLALRSEDADLLGINLAPADFRYQTMTANGTGTAAKVHLDAVRIANIEIDNVDALVMQPGALGRSLLGMSVLSRLGGVHISDGRLVLQR